MLKVFKKITLIFFIFLTLSFLRINVFAADCLDASPSGSLVITTECSFPGLVNGVDSGIGSTNSASIILAPGGKLIILPGQTIATGSLSFSGGSLVKMTGGILKTKTPLWMTDLDADGYPGSTDQFAQSAPPIGGQRRNTQVSMVNLDGNDSFYCPDAYNPNVICNECVGGQLSNQLDGEDRFLQCPAFNLCNGAGTCSLHAKRVFISSVSYNGDLGGLVGADQSCQTLAYSNSLNGTWKAWLSDSVSNVSSRFVHSNYPYILVDETTKIADNWTSLITTPLLSMINKNEKNKTVSNSNVWTNTNIDGSSGYIDPLLVCDDWNNKTKKMSGIFGKNNLYTTTQWTNFGTTACNVQRRLYCFEQ
ncbi:MAG: DUF1554 domain-containing protein [Patescibacteria group bacterium]|jgi:hypothetical protein